MSDLTYQMRMQKYMREFLKFSLFNIYKYTKYILIISFIYIVKRRCRKNIIQQFFNAKILQTKSNVDIMCKFTIFQKYRTYRK